MTTLLVVAVLAFAFSTLGASAASSRAPAGAAIPSSPHPEGRGSSGNSDQYTVTFTARGLPSGSAWTLTAGSPPVTVGNTTAGAKGRVVLTEPPGVLSYRFTGPSGFGVRKVSGTGLPSQSSVVIDRNARLTVHFAPIVELTFTERGLPAGTLWGVAIQTPLPHGGPAAQNGTSTGASTTFSVVQGAWEFQISPMPANYAAAPAHGTVGPGHEMARSIRFRTSLEPVRSSQSGPNGSANNSSGPPPPGLIVYGGQNWSLPSGYYTFLGVVDLTGNASYTLSGTFTADPGVGAYVMTWSEYQAWGSLGVPTEYAWTAGSDATSGSYATVLSAGEYVFIWVNFGSVTSQIEITSNILATPSG